MMDFKLIGHSCPTGKYPSPVLPVGKTARDQTVVLYQGADDPESERDVVFLDQPFVRYGDSLSEAMLNFDPEIHRLFAYDEDNVVFFPKGREPEFFGEFLAEPEYKGSDPFIRLSLAQETRSPVHVLREIARCIVALRGTPEFLNDWCEHEMQELLRAVVQPLSKPRKILLVEDHVATSATLGERYRSKGYHVDSAADGETGLELARATQPDIVILDLDIPKMLGVDVFRHLQSDSPHSGQRVILWSQYHDEWVKHQAEFPGVQTISEFDEVRTDMNSFYLDKNRSYTASRLDELVELST